MPKRNALFMINGCSNHCSRNRASLDFYATDPAAAKWLLKLEPNLSNNIWECACGDLALSNVFTAAGKNVRNTDIVARKEGIEVLDFLSCDTPVHDVDIVTNPPYNKAKEFVEKSISLIDECHYVCMFLKLTFLEGQGRRQLFKDYPPTRVWVSSTRMGCYPNGIPDNLSEYKPSCSAVCYAWFVWQKGYKGFPELRWFN